VAQSYARIRTLLRASHIPNACMSEWSLPSLLECSLAQARIGKSASKKVASQWGKDGPGSNKKKQIRKRKSSNPRSM